MNTKTRVLVGFAIIVGLAVLIFGVEALRRNASGDAQAEQATLVPGSIPIFLNGKLIAGFTPEKLDLLDKVSFVDAAEGKTQDGWLLRDILGLYLPAEDINPDAQITVSSSVRDKTIQLSWAEVNELQNMVMVDLSNRGTLKLVSLLPKLDTREEWIQDTDRIEITQP